MMYGLQVADIALLWMAGLNVGSEYLAGDVLWAHYAGGCERVIYTGRPPATNSLAVNLCLKLLKNTFLSIQIGLI